MILNMFLAESCQGDRTQGEGSVLRIAKSTVGVHSVQHPIYVPTETDGQVRAVDSTPCACARATAKERGTYARGLHGLGPGSNDSNQTI
jgi:hypothetical protein